MGNRRWGAVMGDLVWKCICRNWIGQPLPSTENHSPTPPQPHRGKAFTEHTGTWAQDSEWHPGSCYYPEEMSVHFWPYIPSLLYNASWPTGKQTLPPLTGKQQSSNQRWSLYKLESPKGKSTPQKQEAKHMKTGTNRRLNNHKYPQR